MKILQVIGSLNRGGAETFLMNVLRNIDRDKYQFVFLCYGDTISDYEDEAIQLGARVVRIPEFKDVGLRQHIKDIRRVIRDNKIDIVHAHTYYNSVFSLIAAKLSGIRMRIVHSHNTMSEVNPSLSKRIYFKISSLVINLLSTIRLACGDAAGRALFGSKASFVIVNNGIEIEKFRYSEQYRSKIRKELGIEAGCIVVGHVGRFEEVKNHAFLLDIFKAFHDNNQNSKLVLVGDGPLRSAVEAKIERLELNDDVLLLGKRADVAKIYSAMDVLVFPSLFEGLPLTLVEAQVSGLRCLVSSTVDESARLTDDMHFWSLDESAAKWAGDINTHKPRMMDVDGCILQYDINLSVAKVANIYNKLEGQY